MKTHPYLRRSDLKLHQEAFMSIEKHLQVSEQTERVIYRRMIIENQY